MSALRQPDFSTDYYYPPAQPKRVSDRSQIVESQVKPAKVVRAKAFRASNSLPKNLKTLSRIQQTSFAIAIASMSASIALYASTVQIPKQWSQEYQHLEDLQLQERQLIAINETIKYQIAQEAGKDNRLAISKPESAIFINPAKVEAKKQLERDRDREKAVELKHNSWGY